MCLSQAQNRSQPKATQEKPAKPPAQSELRAIRVNPWVVTFWAMPTAITALAKTPPAPWSGTGVPSSIRSLAVTSTVGGVMKGSLNSTSHSRQSPSLSAGSNDLAPRRPVSNE